MADPYIDQFETQIYGNYACEQMQKTCLGRIPELDPMVQLAISRQAQANAEMKAVLAKQPQPDTTLDSAGILAETRDTITRFSSYLDSLKGYPVSHKVFFHNENPSEVARKRLVKLAGAVKHIAAEIPKHAAITDPTWAAEFSDISQKLEALSNSQQSSKVSKVETGPEVTLQREKWLKVYNANKHLIRGLLAHVDQLDLLPLIFDDLAEVHRAPGVTDKVPAAEPSPDAQEPAPA